MWQNIIAAVYLKVFNLNKLLNISINVYLIYLVNIKIMKKWFEWMI